MEANNLNIIVWNVRGLNNPARRLAVKAEVEDAMASIVCVSKSKLHLVTPFIVMESFGARFDGFVYVPAFGMAGGIVIAWNSQEVSVLASRVDEYSVSIQISRDGADPWWLTAVYGPTVEVLKPAFLNELRMIRAALMGPWAIDDDFNLIAEARDKNNNRVNQRSMALFCRFINGLELKEAHLIGRWYTWSNERDCPTLEKLDRWLCSIEWDEMHSDAVLVARSSLLSDHCPILM
jgi:hypothetical protein